MDFSAQKRTPNGIIGMARPQGIWRARLLGPDGEVKWEEDWHNDVVDEGQDKLLADTLNGGTQVTTWYIGLIDGGSPTIAETDTLSSNGWTENQNYSAGSRPTWSSGSVSGQSIDNSGSVASFSISTNGQTIGGAFLASDSTKGGTSGTLYAAGTFGNSKNADSGDTLEVTATFTMSTS